MCDKPTILIVDDTPANLTLLNSLLKDHYKTKLVSDGRKALDLIEKGDPPDLILLDIMMPGIDGFEVCERLKANEDTWQIPVIFLTAVTKMENEIRGLELGAVDYITKPISPPIMLERVKNHVALKQAKDLLKRERDHLEQKVCERTTALSRMQDAMMVAMGSLAETRDPETGNHINRTQHYVEELARELSGHPLYCNELSPENITLIAKSSPLHDIGKVGIADAILLKPGKLSREEFDEMKRHTTLGHDALAAAESMAGDGEGILMYAKQIAHSHHEKWDGSGYPEGLAGDTIPLSARIMAIGDVYDALISKRPYKEAFSHEVALDNILSGKGNHFDPDVVDAFERIEGKFLEISKRFAD